MQPIGVAVNHAWIYKRDCEHDCVTTRDDCVTSEMASPYMVGFYYYIGTKNKKIEL